MPVSVDKTPKDPRGEWQGLKQMPKYSKLQEDFGIRDTSGHPLAKSDMDPNQLAKLRGKGLEAYMREKKSMRESQSNSANKLELVSCAAEITHVRHDTACANPCVWRFIVIAHARSFASVGCVATEAQGTGHRAAVAVVLSLTLLVCCYGGTVQQLQ